MELLKHFGYMDGNVLNMYKHDWLKVILKLRIFWDVLPCS
jgi:hypothetical protein